MATLNGAEITFGIWAMFEYMENYGADNWDGKGECPQYWKRKGSHHVLIADGITWDMLNNDDLEGTLVNRAAAQAPESNEYVDYWFCGLDRRLTGGLSYDEERESEMLDYEYEGWGSPRKRVDVEPDKYADMAESMGFEA